MHAVVAELWLGAGQHLDNRDGRGELEMHRCQQGPKQGLGQSFPKGTGRASPGLHLLYGGAELLKAWCINLYPVIKNLSWGEVGPLEMFTGK